VLYYWLYLALAPLALGGCACAFLIPRLKQALKIHFWLRCFNGLVMGLFLTDLSLMISPSFSATFIGGIEFVLLGLAALSWFQFCLEYTGHPLLVRWVQILVVLPPIVAGILSWFHPDLAWQGLRIYHLSYFQVIHIDQYGPVGIVGLLPIYLSGLVGMAILVRNIILSHRIFKLQTVWLGIGTLLPAGFHLIFCLRLLPGCDVDYAMELLAVGGFCFAISCRYYHLGSVKPVSRQAVLDQFPTGMVITDSAGNVADLNTTACRLLGSSMRELFGKPIDEVLKKFPGEFTVLRHPIFNSAGQPAAWHLAIQERIPETSDPHAGPVFSAAERRITALLHLNLINKEIASQLNVSVHAVKFHLSNIFRKTGTLNRSELCRWLSENS
jgi:DNA-binding CsgD family transcriptional regulator